MRLDPCFRREQRGHEVVVLGKDESPLLRGHTGPSQEIGRKRRVHHLLRGQLLPCLATERVRQVDGRAGVLPRRPGRQQRVPVSDGWGELYGLAGQSREVGIANGLYGRPVAGGRLPALVPTVIEAERDSKPRLLTSQNLPDQPSRSDERPPRTFAVARTSIRVVHLGAPVDERRDRNRGACSRLPCRFLCFHFHSLLDPRSRVRPVDVQLQTHAPPKTSVAVRLRLRWRRESSAWGKARRPSSDARGDGPEAAEVVASCACGCGDRPAKVVLNARPIPVPPRSRG